MEETDNPAKCNLLREDYLECLHHRKEVCSHLSLVPYPVSELYGWGPHVYPPPPPAPPPF